MSGLAAGMLLALGGLCVPGCDRDEQSTPDRPANESAASSADGEGNGRRLIFDAPLTDAQSSDAETGQATGADAESPPSGAGIETSESGATFRPLTDAKVGEWAIYDALHDRRIRYEVTEVGTLGVKTRVTVSQAGKPLGLPAIREDRPDFDPLARDADRDQSRQTQSPTTIEAAGRTWSAVLHEARWVDEEINYVRRTWVSPEAPIFGTIRMELHGDDQLEARLELVAFGNVP